MKFLALVRYTLREMLTQKIMILLAAVLADRYFHRYVTTAVDMRKPHR